MNEIADSPCPCPESAGYICCNGQCVRENTCQTQPEQGECSYDTDCNGDTGQVCISWKNDAGAVTGPMQCALKCADDSQCGLEELCQLTLHDGQSYSATNVTLACIEQSRLPGCNAAGCSECRQSPIGTTYCADASTVETCVTATNATCGLFCKTIVVDKCLQDSCRKETEDAHARCNDVLNATFFDEELCRQFNCENCDNPGYADSCDNDAVNACLWFPIEHNAGAVPPACDALCLQSQLQNCD